MRPSLSLPPCTPGGQDQNRKDLQSARQHIPYQHQLGKDAVGGKIAGGAHRLKSRTDIVKTRQNGGEIGRYGKAVHRDQQKADNDNDKIRRHVGVGVGQHFLVHCLPVHPYHLYPLGTDKLTDAAQHILHHQQRSAAFETAARAARTGADNHQNQQNRLGKPGP